ncbi:MAG: hypothetical protein V3V08_10870 [Nannocystaceae bacterium]
MAKARIMLGIYLDDKALFQSGYGHLSNTMHDPRHQDPGIAEAEIPFPAASPIDKDDPMALFELAIDYDGEHTEINRNPAPNGGHVSMDVEALFHTAESLCHQGYDMYGMKMDYRLSDSSPYITDSKPRFLLNADWMVASADPGIVMKFYPSKGLQQADYMGSEINIGSAYENVYNHYKHRRSDTYDISTLEAFVLSKRAAGKTGLDTLLYADLDEGLGRTDCSWGGAGDDDDDDDDGDDGDDDGGDDDGGDDDDDDGDDDDDDDGDDDGDDADDDGDDDGGDDDGDDDDGDDDDGGDDDGDASSDGDVGDAGDGDGGGGDGPGDAGGGVEDDASADGGCGCAIVRPSSAGFLVGLSVLGVVGVGRRRRGR